MADSRTVRFGCPALLDHQGLCGVEPCRNALIERLVEMHDHNDARLYRDAKQRDISDPNGDTEVIAEQSLQDQPASRGIERGKIRTIASLRDTIVSGRRLHILTFRKGPLSAVQHLRAKANDCMCFYTRA
jgi:hypothetical protein